MPVYVANVVLWIKRRFKAKKSKTTLLMCKTFHNIMFALISLAPNKKVCPRHTGTQACILRNEFGLEI